MTTQHTTRPMATRNPTPTDRADDQLTLSAYDHTAAFPDPGTSDTEGCRPDELEASDDATTRLVKLTGDDRWTDDELATFYERGYFPAEIARDLGLERSEGADRLRRAGHLQPHDDYRTLAELYDERGYSTTEIAETACDRQVSSETVAERLHRFGLHQESAQDKLAAMDPDELDLSTDADDREERRVRA